jgi:hypothetical protein
LDDFGSEKYAKELQPCLDCSKTVMTSERWPSG